MADKVRKPKKKTPKPKAGEKGVMAALPSTRPERIGTRRDAPESAPAPKPAAKRKAGVTAGRRKAAAPRTFEPTRAAEAAAGAADERAAGAVPLDQTPGQDDQRDPGTRYPRPRPVGEGAPGIGAGYRDRPQAPGGGSAGGGVLGSAVHVAGEVAHTGLTLGGRLVKGAVGRLPRP